MTLVRQELQAELAALVESSPKISTHCHQLPASALAGFDLDSLLRNSYVNWTGIPWGATPESRAAMVEKVRFNSFFVWLQKSLIRLYGTDEPLTAETWQNWDERVKAAYRDLSHPRQVLGSFCNYRRMLLDAYWQPGSDNNDPGLFAPVYRVNAFFFGYSVTAADHDGNNPYRLRPHVFLKDFDEYTAWMREEILAHRSAGCVALKLPIAYDRGLDFEPVELDKARRVFKRLTNPPRGSAKTSPAGNLPGKTTNAPDPAASGRSTDADPLEVKTFQDALFHRLCQIAAELDLPLQIHTGMGQARRTNAAWLQEGIARNPATRFVLLHCSYPWTADINMLVDKFPNVSADLSMLPLLSIGVAERMIGELVERASLDRLFWGCDTWTAEESYGALLAFCQALSSSLAAEVVEGYLSRQDALQVMQAILIQNPLRFYKIDASG